MKTHAEALAILLGTAREKSPEKRRAVAAASSPSPYGPPVDAVVIGVDPGTERSGWGIEVRGRAVGFGEVEGLDPVEIDKVIATAERFAELAGAERDDGQPLRVAMVVEKPPPASVIYKGRSSVGVEAVQRARGQWQSAWRRAGFASWLCCDAPLSTWRSAMLGRGWKGMDTGDVERMLAAAAVRAAGLQGVPGPDASPAILITSWGSRAPVVRKAVERRTRRVGSRKRARTRGGGVLRGGS